MISGRDETTRQLSIVSVTQDTKITEKAGVLDMDKKARGRDGTAAWLEGRGQGRRW